MQSVDLNPVSASASASENAPLHEEKTAEAVVEQQSSAAQSRNRKKLYILAGVAALVVIGLVVGLSVGLTANKSSPAPQSVSANSKECVTNYDSNTDYFPEKLDFYVPNPNFDVKYFKNYKVITNSLNPNKIETIVAYQCGTPKPDLKDVNATLVLPIPIKSIFVGDTTSISFLELLGVRDTIKASDSLQYATSPCLRQANETGFGPVNVDSYVDPEKALEEAEKTDLAVDYLDSNTAKAKNYITFPATADLSAYNRISWLGFLGSFYNLEAEANSLMKKMADNYNCIKSKQAAESQRPTLAWIEYLPAQDYTLNTSVYVLNRWPVYVQYTLDAGATNVSVPLSTIDSQANTTLAEAIGTPFRSYFSDRTAFMDILKDVDIVIDETYFFVAPTLEEVLGTFEWNTTAAADEFKFVKNKAIWRNDKRKSSNGGSDWFETAVVSANLVLNDMSLIVKGSEGQMYFRNAWKNATDLVIMTPDSCGKTGQEALTVSGLGSDFGSDVKLAACNA